MRIVKGVYIVSRLTFLLTIGMVYLTSLGYFFGWDLEIKSFLTYVSIIFIEVIIFTTIFLIVKKTRKKHDEFSTDMTIFLYTRENRESITSVNDVIQIFYVRFLWVLLLQIGAGYLHIEYKDMNGDIKQYTISMSLKDVRQLEKMYKIKINVR
jgi:hypothetical protein